MPHNQKDSHKIGRKKNICAKLAYVSQSSDPARKDGSTLLAAFLEEIENDGNRHQLTTHWR
ncbi:hypothetical protein OUZ56_002884 [Daphnia magna]|uniref:Uncharacterized protein n=1 Tax=Daphnia magna TaxID=35525 RepID=A0ABR0A729_9CRUS|nr:hypothetical protein OUZ56_002884 [Daphnia magna]